MPAPPNEHAGGQSEGGTIPEAISGALQFLNFIAQTIFEVVQSFLELVQDIYTTVFGSTPSAGADDADCENPTEPSVTRKNHEDEARIPTAPELCFKAASELVDLVCRELGGGLVGESFGVVRRPVW